MIVSGADDGFRADVKFEPIRPVPPPPPPPPAPPVHGKPYKYGYEVSAAGTGDTKTHQESFEDGVLRGSYSVIQPDGVRRVVNYVSDAENL